MSSLADRIEDLVCGRNPQWPAGQSVSHGIILHTIGKEKDLRGDHAFVQDKANIVLMAGCSQELVNALMTLLKEKRVAVNPCPFLMMFVDGCPVPNLPLARKPPKNGYKKPHYMPCVLNPPGCIPKDLRFPQDFPAGKWIID